MSSIQRDSSPPRVFVSSVMRDFDVWREAARRGISAANAEPVLIEDYPAIASSPRNACLDGVESCDACILVVGSRGGYRTPSGQLVVEEECEYARRKGIPLVVFVQDVDRDADAQALVDAMSDYVDGNLRVTFDTPEELEREVNRSTSAMFTALPSGTNPMEQLQATLEESGLGSHDPSLRVCLQPDRSEEVIDPLELGSHGFGNMLRELAHQPGCAASLLRTGQQV